MAGRDSLAFDIEVGATQNLLEGWKKSRSPCCTPTEFGPMSAGDVCRSHGCLFDDATHVRPRRLDRKWCCPWPPRDSRWLPSTPARKRSSPTRTARRIDTPWPFARLSQLRRSSSDAGTSDQDPRVELDDFCPQVVALRPIPAVYSGCMPRKSPHRHADSMPKWASPGTQSHQS
jgi:hypothetical protein